MTNKRIIRTGALVLMSAIAWAPQAKSSTDDVYWHIDPGVKSCSMVIDPSLTQSQWHTFTEQAAAIVAFKSLASASTLGKGELRISINGSRTPVDQHNSAWINTFVHPDADCPLGDAIAIPTLRASVGVTDRVDIGGYWTTAPRANYGMVGGEVKYGFVRESAKCPAAAVRASAVFLTGVPDFNVNVYSLDLITSKTFAHLSPYVGFRHSLAIGTETTTKVDLKQEQLTVTQGYAGVSYPIWMVDLAVEYNVGTVNTLALALGFRL
jgi:hypothetical protein